MAYVPTDHAPAGHAFEIDVRGKVRAAETRSKPLYHPKET
jgi:glycine cleavage system aminomethyltransferase T